MDQAFSNNNNEFFGKNHHVIQRMLVYLNEIFLIYILLKFADSTLKNSCIIALLTAAFLALRLTCASDVVSMFIISERIS
jgi:hypothetical protein